MTPVLDRDHFAYMTGHDAVLQREILGLFRGQIDGWEAVFAAGGDWRTAVHTLKGSARGIGLMRLAAACEAAENAPHEGLAGVRAALNEALAELEQFAADAA